MGLEVAYKAFVGDDAVFLESVHPPSDIDADVSTRVRDGEDVVFKNHLVWDVFEMDPHVLEVGHWVVELVFYDVFRQVAGPSVGFGDDGVEVYLEVF